MRRAFTSSVLLTSHFHFSTSSVTVSLRPYETKISGSILSVLAMTRECLSGSGDERSVMMFIEEGQKLVAAMLQQIIHCLGVRSLASEMNGRGYINVRQ